MHCFVFLSLLSHYSTAVFTRVPFFDRKAKGVKGLGPFSDLWPQLVLSLDSAIATYFLTFLSASISQSVAGAALLAADLELMFKKGMIISHIVLI